MKISKNGFTLQREVKCIELGTVDKVNTKKLLKDKNLDIKTHTVVYY